MKLRINKVKEKIEVEIPVEVTIKGITTTKLKNVFKTISNKEVDIEIEKSELENFRASLKTARGTKIELTYEEII